MQSINARKDYGNSLRCAWIIYKHEGLLSFWSGATPRLARLLLSGGIVFTVYGPSQLSSSDMLGMKKSSKFLRRPTQTADISS